MKSHEPKEINNFNAISFFHKFYSFFKDNKKILKKSFNIALTCLLVFFVWHFKNSLIDAVKLSLSIGHNLIWLPILFLLWNFFATKAWQVLLGTVTNKSTYPLWYLYIVRIQSQALNLILPVSGLGGEALRAVKTGTDGLKNSVTSVAFDKTIDVLSEFVLALFGFIIALQFFPFPKTLSIISSLLLTFILCLFVFWSTIWSGTSRLWKFKFGKAVIISIAANKKIKIAASKTFLCHFIEHILMAIEIYIVSFLLGIHLGIRDMFFINTISSVFNILFIFIPGRVGSYECSLAFAFSQLSLPPASGVSVALIRRARQIIICIIGLFLIYFKAKPSKRFDSVSIPQPARDII